MTLGAGDTLVVYTDGLSEAMSPERELFGVDRLAAALADDLTVILLRRHGGPAAATLAHANVTSVQHRARTMSGSGERRSQAADPGSRSPR